MKQSQIQCPIHGREGIGLVCEHIAVAVDRGERVGFYWGDDSDTARPDAWCLTCERALVTPWRVIRAMVPGGSFQDLTQRADQPERIFCCRL